MRRTRAGEAYKQEKPEAFAKIAKAMEISKGKTDTWLAQVLAEIPTSTAEDIARLRETNEERYLQNLWKKNENRGEEKKKENKNEAFAFSFNDTFAARYMRKLGLGEILDKTTSRYDSVFDKKMLATAPESFRYKISRTVDSDIRRQFFAIMDTPLEIREEVFGSPDMVAIWTSGRHYEPSLPRWDDPYRGLSYDEFDKKDKEFKKKLLVKKGKEMIMLVKAPEDIKNQVVEYMKNVNNSKQSYHRYCFTTMADIWYRNKRLAPWKLDKELEFEDFYNALDYMGIGFTCVEKASIENRKNIRQFVTHVVSSTRRFNADIKRGHSPAHVRALLVEDLNIWLKQRVEDKWVAFARVDAKEHYPEIEPKKKKQEQPHKVETTTEVKVDVREILKKKLPETKEEIVAQTESKEAMADSIMQRLKKLGL